MAMVHFKKILQKIQVEIYLTFCLDVAQDFLWLVANH